MRTAKILSILAGGIMVLGGRIHLLDPIMLRCVSGMYWRETA
jgi:hypothetical protein